MTLIFGNDTVATTYAEAVIDNQMILGCFRTNNVIGKVVSVKAVLMAMYSQALIYDYNCNLVAKSNQVSDAGAGEWTTFTFPDTVLLAPNSCYYLGIWADDPEGFMKVNTTGGTGMYHEEVAYNPSNPPNSPQWGYFDLSFSKTEYNPCIYCEYEFANELCQWIYDNNGVTVNKIFGLINSYLQQAPPTGYTFIPTVQNIFGLVNYYLGGNGDTGTGCGFDTDDAGALEDHQYGTTTGYFYKNPVRSSQDDSLLSWSLAPSTYAKTGKIKRIYGNVMTPWPYPPDLVEIKIALSYNDTQHIGQVVKTATIQCDANGFGHYDFTINNEAVGNYFQVWVKKVGQTGSYPWTESGGRIWLQKDCAYWDVDCKITVPAVCPAAPTPD